MDYPVYIKICKTNIERGIDNVVLFIRHAAQDWVEVLSNLVYFYLVVVALIHSTNPWFNFGKLPDMKLC